MKNLFSIFFIFLLMGCQSAPQRESLPLVTESVSFHISEKFSIIAKSPGGIRWEYVVLPGEYSSERRGKDGTYFFGSGRSVIEISELYNNQLRTKIGGLFIPDDAKKPIYAFYVFETDIQTIEAMDAYVLNRQLNGTNGQAPNGIGVNVVGNALGGAVVNAIIESGVGELVQVFTELDSDLSSSIRADIQRVIAKNKH